MEYNLSGSYELVQCDDCGMCYADMSATSKDYEEYYRNVNLVTGRSVKPAPIREHVLIDTATLMVKKEDKILDIGTGSGWWLKKLQSVGYCELFGIDTSDVNV